MTFDDRRSRVHVECIDVEPEPARRDIERVALQDDNPRTERRVDPLNGEVRHHRRHDDMGSAWSHSTEPTRSDFQERIAHGTGKCKDGPGDAPTPTAPQSEGSTSLEREIPERRVLGRRIAHLQDWIRTESKPGDVRTNGCRRVHVVRLTDERRALRAGERAQRPRAARPRRTDDKDAPRPRITHRAPPSASPRGSSATPGMR